MAAVNALMTWRYQLGINRERRHASGPFPIDTVIPVEVIKSLARNAHWKTVEDVEKALAKQWVFCKELAGEALEVLRAVDGKVAAQAYLTGISSKKARHVRGRPGDNKLRW